MSPTASPTDQSWPQAHHKTLDWTHGSIKASPRPTHEAPFIRGWTCLASQIDWVTLPLISQYHFQAFTSPAPCTTVQGLIPIISPSSHNTSHSVPLTEHCYWCQKWFQGTRTLRIGIWNWLTDLTRFKGIKDSVANGEVDTGSPRHLSGKLTWAPAITCNQAPRKNKALSIKWLLPQKIRVQIKIVKNLVALKYTRELG